MIEKFFGFHTESARWIRAGVRTVLKNELTSEKKQKTTQNVVFWAFVGAP